jgi:hypothetical protein
MSTKTEALALHLVCALYDVPDGKPQEWRMLEKLDGMTAEAIVFAVEQGWVTAEAGHSICLTDTGRRLLDRLAG